MLADAGVDALLVASPTDTHADLIEAGAAAGKAILCEKPVDLDVARARAAVAAAERAGILLAIGFNRRYDPSFRRIRQGIDDGEIGAVESVLIVSRDPSPPPVAYVRRSGGMFRDMTIHDLDMARWLLGEEPVEVTAHGSCLVDPAIGAAGDIDTAAVTLRTASGRIAQVANTRRAVFGYDQRIEVCGARGMLAAGNRKSTSVERATAGRLRDRPALPFFLERYAEAYRLELDAFVRRLHGEAADIVSGGDGVRALEIADACDQLAAHPRHRPAGDPCMKKLSRRPDRQRLHRPRACDRAAGSRRGVPGRRRHRCARCSRTATRRSARSPPRRMGFARSTGDWRELVADPAVDVVDICSPNYLHREMALAAIAAGKHVWCEKPLALDAAEARGSRRCRGASRRRAPDRVQLLVQPADPPRAVDDRVRRLGTVMGFSGRYFEDYMADPAVPHSWRCERRLAGAGALADLGSHLIDMAEVLLGPIESVFAGLETVHAQRRVPATGAMLPVENEDIARGLVRFARGVGGSFEISRVATGYKCGLAFTVFGSARQPRLRPGAHERAQALQLGRPGRAAAASARSSPGPSTRTTRISARRRATASASTTSR